MCVSVVCFCSVLTYFFIHAQIYILKSVYLDHAVILLIFGGLLLNWSMLSHMSVKISLIFKMKQYYLNILFHTICLSTMLCLLCTNWWAFTFPDFYCFRQDLLQPWLAWNSICNRVLSQTHKLASASPVLMSAWLPQVHSSLLFMWLSPWAWSLLLAGVAGWSGSLELAV